jgi:intracellular sulfur oxidation DsrE/DsrF family protein
MTARPVRFERKSGRQIQITLRNRKLDKDKFIPEATYVPSGVAEITRLQQREGYAYLRP